MASQWPVTPAQRRARRRNARLSRGPTTSHGLDKCRQASLTHGGYSAQSRAEHKEAMALLKQCRETLQGLR